MTLDQLKSFIEIAELRSFSKAANKVCLSQPTVSCQIKSLEEELGTKLFDRLGKKVFLTKPGDILLGYAREIIDLEQKSKIAIDDILDIKKGEIRLGSSNIPGSYCLPPLIQKFTKQNPKVKIISKIADTQSIANDVINGVVDLGVIGYKIDNSQLISYRFIEDIMMLALNSKHPLANRDSITVKELQSLPFIIREEGSGSRKTIEEILYQRGLYLASLNIIAQLGNMESIKQAIKSDIGVTILSLCAISDEIKFGYIKCVPIEDIVFERSFYIILRNTKSHLPVVNFFKDFLLEQKKNFS